MALKSSLIEKYGLPILDCHRWGKTKGASSTDILKGMLWNVFGKWIRRRDKGKCIACGLTKTFEELQAGHYVPVGGNDASLIFEETNVNGECEGCNGFDPFHLVPMRKNLITKYGIEVVENLDRRKAEKKAIKLDEWWYASKIIYYHETLQDANKEKR